MTEQQFIKRIKLRIIFSALIMLAGVAIAFLPKENLSDLVSAYRYGAIGGLIGAGFATIVNNIMILKNKECRQNEFIKQTDERNVLISKNAYGISWLITLLLLGITPLFLPLEAAQPILCIMGISVFSYAVGYWIFRKKM